MHCRKCGKEQPDYAEFCSGCGCSLREEPVVQEQAASAPRKKSGERMGKLAVFGALVLIVVLAAGVIVSIFAGKGREEGRQPEPSLQEQENASSEAEPEVKPEIELETKPEAEPAIRLDREYCFLEAGEFVQLEAITEPASAAAEITWTSSDESGRLIVVEGLVYCAAVNFENAVITATTADGASASCVVMEKRGDSVCEQAADGWVYSEIPAILSMENVFGEQEEIALLFDVHLEDVYESRDAYCCTYQTQTQEQAERYIKAYEAFLVEKGYIVDMLYPEEVGSWLWDPSGQYQINIRCAPAEAVCELVVLSIIKYDEM